MTNNNPSRVGLIGCGYQGRWLARAAAQVERLHLTGCADPNADATQAVQSINDGITVYSTPEALIDSNTVDAVLVATPHHLLHPYALAAVKAGKHVLAEKPIALNAQQAQELERAVATQGVSYMAGYSFRYFDQPRLAKQLLSDGVIGRIQTISAGMNRPALRGGWASDPAAGGGMLGFFGCHLVDRILWYVDDEPVEVFAEVRYHPSCGVDLTSIFQVRFAKGLTASFNLCGQSHGPFDFAHIGGDAGYLYLTVETVPQYKLTASSRTVEKYATPQTYISDLTRDEAILQMMVAELNDFADALTLGRQVPITLKEGRKVLELLDAVILSGQTGQPVQLNK